MYYTTPQLYTKQILISTNVLVFIPVAIPTGVYTLPYFSFRDALHTTYVVLRCCGHDVVCHSFTSDLVTMSCVMRRWTSGSGFRQVLQFQYFFDQKKISLSEFIIFYFLQTKWYLNSHKIRRIQSAY